MNGDWQKGFFFSQHAINIFHQCPLRFKKRYIDGLFWKNALSGENQMELGMHFHLLAERYFSRVPLHMEFFEEYGTLNEWMDALIKSMEQKKAARYYPEYQIKIREEGLMLQAKYDLIVIDDRKRLTIYDWKTEEKPLSRRRMMDAVQTRVYRYVLVKGGERLVGQRPLPEDVTMIYWQPSRPQNPLVLPYDKLQYQEDEKFLKATIHKIKSFDYDSYDRALSRQYCSKCEYNYFCNDDRVAYKEIFPREEIELEDWDEIPEICF